MSASNEKKTRKDAISETPKTAMEIEKQKAEKRSNFLYGLIAVVFVVCRGVSGLEIRHCQPHRHRRDH